MPAEQGLRPDEQQRLVPGAAPAGQQHEQSAVGRGAAWALDGALENDELLAQEGMLGDEGGATAHEVSEGTRHDTVLGGLRCSAQAVPERAGKGASEMGAMAEHARQHAGS